MKPTERIRTNNIIVIEYELGKYIFASKEKDFSIEIRYENQGRDIRQITSFQNEARRDTIFNSLTPGKIKTLSFDSPEEYQPDC